MALKAVWGSLLSALLLGFALSAQAQEGAVPAVAPGAGVPSAAAPAPQTVEQELARTMFETAIEKSARGEWSDALALLVRSRALVDRPVTALNQALVLARLSRLQEAVVVLDEARALTRTPDDDELVQRIATLRAEIVPLVGELRVQVEPALAQLSVDGVPKPVAAEGKYAVALDPGAHRVEASAPHYESSFVELRLARGERRTLELVLTRVPAPSVVAIEPARPPEPSSRKDAENRTPLARSARLWVPIAAVLAVGLTVGIVLSLQGGDGASPKPDGGESGRVLSPP